MRKAIMLFLAALMCSMVIACGDDDNDDTSDASDDSAVTGDAGADAAAD